MASVFFLLSSNFNLLLALVVFPAVLAPVMWAVGKRNTLRTALTVAGGLVNLLFAVALFKAASDGEQPIAFTLRFGSGSLDMGIKADAYSALFLFLGACAFGIITLYCTAWLKDKPYAGLFMMYLFISLAMVNGAFISDSMGLMLFFWEGLLCTLLGLLLIGNRKNYKTAVKALSLSGIADLLLMLGIIVTVYAAKTSFISKMHGIPVSGAGAVGFACLMSGTLGKAGCMPFHSWIPAAANDAKLPFMAFFPGAMEKLVGFYLAVRVMTDIYEVKSGDPASVAVMALGDVTLVFAVAMALVQKDMKKLLSYHAVSQVGYMVLGIGSALPVGIAGGLFHMLNNVIYKSALFMVAGILEQKLGTTDLRKFGGLGKKMPVTAACFTLCGLSIAGVPPFNGFFSKELIFDAALESECSLHYVFYGAALLGAFMTAVSFLKMGRAAFCGKTQLPEGVADVDEKGLGLKLPACIMAGLCLVFGLWNTLPVDGWFKVATKAEEALGGWPHSPVLVIISVCVLLLAVADHAYGCKKTGKAITAADHIHYAPVLKTIYKWADKGAFDPYNWLTAAADGFGTLCVQIEKGVSFIYDKAVPGAVKKTGDMLSKADNGALSRYIIGVAAGLLIAALVIFSVVTKS